MFFLCRLERKCVATRLVLQRALSGADAVNALRPFYFAVHPDFFGQYPRERVGLLYTVSWIKSLIQMKIRLYIKQD